MHCHLLFHLPVEYRSGKKLIPVRDAISRLVSRHGRGITDERVIKLLIHENPDGKYLIKGGGPKGLEALSVEEGSSAFARHHPRQALWHHGQHRTSCAATQARRKKSPALGWPVGVVWDILEPQSR